MDKNIMPEVVKIIRELIKPGDIVNVSGAPSWYDIPLHIAYWGIRTAQKGLFGKSSAWRDTHTMIYFADGTFSVEPPKATYVPIEDYAMKDISFYRYTKKDIYKADIEILRKGADQIIGTSYDIGQLLDIAIGQVCGYPVEDKINIFDTGKKNVVCSVGAAAVYTYWRHELEKIGIKLPRLFSKLNDKAWDKDFIRYYHKCGNKWSVERTYPANFANCKTHFDDEFELVLKMKAGEILYLNT